MTNRPDQPPIDIDQARRLLDALEQDLRRTDADPQRVETLLAEVTELRAVLEASEHADEAVHSGLHGMRDRLHQVSDELIGDAFQVGRYLAELGRILGL